MQRREMQGEQEQQEEQEEEAPWEASPGPSISADPEAEAVEDEDGREPSVLSRPTGAATSSDYGR